MASRVVRLTNVMMIEHSVEDDHVVLKITGRSRGKVVRVELELDNYGLMDAVMHMREGTNSQVSAWTDTQKRLNQP